MGRPQTISDDEILHAAREVFVEHGPSAPVSLIAERLGVSSAALFQRVGSKARLMMRALGPVRPPAMDALEAGPPATHARDALVELLLGLMSFFHEIVPNLVVLRSAGIELSPSSATEPPPLHFRRQLTRWLAEAVANDRLATLRPRATAEALLGAMEARCFNAHLGGRNYAPGSDSEFIEFLVAGLIDPLDG